jgi:glycine/D-amino acid oxidase-like deaminating enzyme
MAAEARRLGATILEQTPVTCWGADGSSVWIDTADGRYAGDAMIVTAGAWSSRMLAELRLPIEVRRKTLWWQAVDRPERYAPERFPIFISDSEHGEIYGFPIHGTPGLKIANHSGGEPTAPFAVDRTTHDGENADCLRLAANLLPGLNDRVVKSAVCLYAVTPDMDFIVDRHPIHERVTIGAGFSGHGFKFAPAIGEMLAALATAPGSTMQSRFSISRFASPPG